MTFTPATSDSDSKDDSGRFRWSSTVAVSDQMQKLYERVKARDPSQTEFLQAFREVLFSLMPLFQKHPKYLPVMETIAEAERAIQFRVTWLDDQGVQCVNRGYRVQYSSALGPYKGGLRFHPSVNLGIIKFLGFEQIFKNALTGLPMGGGKGGSDFDPKGKSDAEILRFCQSFMTSLSRHIGPNMDVPAGDIGVGGREIGYMYGQYKRMTSQFEGVLTGKNPLWGGSLIRPEATGYGAVYFAKNYLEDLKDSFKDKACVVSGSGNVSQYTIQKLINLGAKVLTFSDSSGYVVDNEGMNEEKLAEMMRIKNVERGRVDEYCKKYTNAKFVAAKKPWEVACFAAFPSATQNEIGAADAEILANNGCKLVVEGANMPSTDEAIAVMKKKGVVLCPAKAANAGGVAVSGLEMSQNSARLYWTRETVDAKLEEIMKSIYVQCRETAKDFGVPGDFQTGANIAGFMKVAEAVIQQGCV
eukprot:GHVO01043225.1.p1 GENE.GHVO01043225.1~~GHVO01043225.1.p1  ORF type:complete len:472 (+),score=79.14 GHVO01043225.1:35-1450(+)